MQQNQEINKKEQYNLNKLQKRLRRNVGEAIAKTNVYGVDVSGGIESAKGVKSLEKMTGFLAKVRN